MKDLYFFADHPFDIPLYLGIINAVREVSDAHRFTLIVDSHPNLDRYDLSCTLNHFHQVIDVGFCNYGGIRQVMKTMQFARELASVKFRRGSLLFLSSGRQAVSNVLLSTARKNKLRTVWLTQRDHMDLEDVRFDYKRTILFNIYHYFWGKAFVDVHRRRDAREASPYIHFRSIPYDFTFYLRSAYDKATCLKPDEFFFPYYFPIRKTENSQETQETILLCGAPFENREWLRRDLFLALYNRLIDSIRRRHASAKLIYLPHPREQKEAKCLDLRGFEMIWNQNSELLLAHYPSISTVYSIWSTASLTATLFGARGYWFYKLFSDAIMDKERKDHFNARYHEANSRMFIEDFELWMSGYYDYSLGDITQRVEASTLEMIRRIGIGP